MVPVREAEFAPYLQHLGETTSSKSTVEEAINDVSGVQQLGGFPPTHRLTILDHCVRWATAGPNKA